MKILASTCNLLLAGSLLWLTAGCAKPLPEVAGEPGLDEAEQVDQRGFAPLELSRDREVVPAKYPRTGDLAGKQIIVEVDPDEAAVDSLAVDQLGPVLVVDSLNKQAYRVQLFTSRVYGEARQAAKVAEEIFDQPVYVDYQVPNYKVRVGSFADRYAAEDYQQKAKAAGFRNAWVVMVNVGVRELAPLYNDMTEPLLPIPVMSEDSSTTKEEQGSDSEN